MGEGRRKVNWKLPEKWYFCNYFTYKCPFIDLNDSGLDNQYTIARLTVWIVMLHLMAPTVLPPVSSFFYCFLFSVGSQLDPFASLCSCIHSLSLEYLFPSRTHWISVLNSSQRSPFCEVFSDCYPNRVYPHFLMNISAIIQCLCNLKYISAVIII